MPYLPGTFTFEKVVLAGAALAGLVACFVLTTPFLPAIIGSVTLAVLLAPAQMWLAKHTRSEGLSAFITVLVGAFIIVVPTVLIATSILSESARGLATIAPLINPRIVRESIPDIPILQGMLQWAIDRLDIASLATALTSWLAGWSKSMVQTSLSSSLSVLAAFYFLFYLLRDGDRFVELLRQRLPLSSAEFDQLSKRFTDTIFATIFGTAIVSVLQGGLGALMFWWLGLPAPAFWGLAMAMLAVVPFLGAFVIWVPVAIWLVLTGQLMSAALLTTWGVVVVGFADNLAYPILVGQRLRMHTIPSFISIVGGVIVLGPAGIILGPLIFSVAMTLSDIWSCRTASLDVSAPNSLAPTSI